MAYWAKVHDGIVKELSVFDDDVTPENNDGTTATWIQCSRNTIGGVHYDPETGLPSDDQTKALRYNCATVGGFYDEEADAFYDQKTFDSWVLDTTTYLWKAPVDCPAVTDALENWAWDEANQQWIDET